MPFGSYYAGRRVLVTGDTGFKGSWLSQWLIGLGADVYGIGLEPDTEPSAFEALGLRERIRHRTLDIRSLPELGDFVRRARPQVVFHMAAQSLVRRSYRAPVETLETNVMGTANVLAAVGAALADGLDRCSVIVVTSDKCYENRESGVPFRESDRMGGADLYSASKGAAELVVRAWRHSFADDTLAIASCRAGNVIGGGDWAEDRIVPDCIRALERSEPVRIRNPGAIRPWQHVLEPLSGYLLVGSLVGGHPSHATGWNFGPGRSAERSVADLCQLVVDEWGEGSWHAESEPEAPPESHTLRLSIEKARDALGWKPAWTFEEAVSRTVGWYRRVARDPLAAVETTSHQIAGYVGDARRLGNDWAGS